MVSRPGCPGLGISVVMAILGHPGSIKFFQLTQLFCCGLTKLEKGIFMDCRTDPKITKHTWSENKPVGI